MRAVGAAMSFDGMRRPSFSQANVQIAGASELMSPASEPNTLVVPVCALVPTPDGAAQDEIEGEGEGDLDGVWAPRRLGRRGRDRIEAQD